MKMGFGKVTFVCEHDSDATADELWRIISDWERTTEFWKGTREISRIEDDTFQVRFAFPGNARMKLILDEKERSVTEQYLNGPFKGTKKTSVENKDGKVRLRTEWNVVLSPLLMFGWKSIQNHFSEGTKNALKRISDSSSGPP